MSSLRVSKRHLESALRSFEFERAQMPVDEPRSLELFGMIIIIKEILAGKFSHPEVPKQ